ncbi:cytochrome c-type biogenesis protein [Paragemmobacter straminiformis]|uniref:Cytochrome c-type biogenesis protein n=1 Tax=Paragemmobacter straminiformis TaxID=2045119 RepID=A0A842I7H9_9RHOB|nr:cytochrome c-type biogenesis protein [Gemmobacter straminiformis]MBC2835327.1 cytochrome c-type biogenesis protein CcmH [Gemmobacter straminiformis]
MKRALVLALALGAAAPVFAVQPSEMLADPALEARARELSKELRCPVCQNENIDDSDAQIAKTLREVIRARITEGDTDAEVMAFVTDRFGEFVLLKPATSGWNLMLWAAGPLMLLGGIAVAAVTLRRRGAGESALSAEEEARLAELMKD